MNAAEFNKRFVEIFNGPMSNSPKPFYVCPLCKRGCGERDGKPKWTQLPPCFKLRPEFVRTEKLCPECEAKEKVVTE